MKYHYQEHVYRTGSASGYVGIEASDKFVPKKFNYIKVVKDGAELYLDRKGELVSYAWAANFNYDIAHKIVMKMRADSTYKNCEITRYETNSRLNANTKLCKNMPSKLLNKDNTSQPTIKDLNLIPEVYVGMKVLHKLFGEGEIVKIDDNMGHIKIAFSEFEKEFSFPSCFECGFLKAE